MAKRLHPDAAGMSPTATRYWPKWAAALWFTAGLATLLTLGACRSRAPILDAAPKPTDVNGTISGTVRGAEGTNSVDGRAVEIVNVSTGERQRTTTNPAGGFTFRVKPGKYRVQLAVRDGEAIVKQPGVIDVDRSDVDAFADFVLGSGRVLRPRHPAYRTDTSLGAPIA